MLDAEQAAPVISRQQPGQHAGNERVAAADSIHSGNIKTGYELAAGRHGLEAIDRAAERLRAILVVFEEHHTDDELADITEFLAVMTLFVARDGGFDQVFRPFGPPRPDDDVLL